MRINSALLAALALACAIASAGEASANGRLARGAAAVGKWAFGGWAWDQLFSEDNVEASDPKSMTDICETAFGTCVLPYPGPIGTSCYCVAADGMTDQGITR
jgi:hypothetical protein